MTNPTVTGEAVERVARWCGQGGDAHKLMVVLACAARHEYDDLDADGPHEFIELDAATAGTLNDLLGDLRDLAALTKSPPSVSELEDFAADLRARMSTASIKGRPVLHVFDDCVREALACRSETPPIPNPRVRHG